ncbi:hypothetical protein CLG96_03105 [Sphingomonas oleivorans]|uniref:Acyltransferase 3 domain-containing protein n=1 Tax=Sphingomonas oleivorans TaxID=1735121 RepID=A0A2T5G1V6_9SPHN|nr:acyltransferase [Sphingomonas oleivorans]PTQ13133.1 hypothetical protein CLG96_03105 [Sphingomonas oleivorans]
MDRQKFIVLESWRGICAVIVALYHLSAAGHFYNFPVVRNGEMGVIFFFVLSGFVMMHAYGRKISGWSDAAPFFLRRFGRIYPLHLFTLLLLVGSESAKFILVTLADLSSGSKPFSDAWSIPSLFGNLLLIQGLGFFPRYSWNIPSWTISAEFWVYAVFFVALVLGGVRYRRIALGLAMLAAAMVALNCAMGFPLRRIEGAGAMECIYGFFLGTLAYQFFLARREHPGQGAWLEIVATGLILLMFMMDFTYQPLVAPAIFAWAITIFARSAGPVSGILATKPFVMVGTVSFSIYLIHFPILTVMNDVLRVAQAKLHIPIFGAVPGVRELLITIGGPWAMDALAIVYVALLLFLSRLTYSWIEVPFRDYFNRIADGWAARRGKALAV